MGLILSTIPGFSDLSDTVLAADQASRGLHVEEISANAAFGMARCEVFQGLYFNGDTVPLPVSGIDGYAYSREELIYVYNISVSTNKDSGWIQIGTGSLWYCNWFVDQATGEVTSSEWYRNAGTGGSRTETNDGQIIVYTIGQRQRQNIIMASTPNFSTINPADIATDKPWKQSLAQGLNENAKFCVTNTEVFFCGEFTNGQVISTSTMISPADGYHYGYSEAKFLPFWRWTTDGASLTQPPEIYGQLGPFACAVDATGHVSTYVEAIDSGGTDHVTANNGRVAVVAFCTRSATPGSAPLANSFSEIDDSFFMPGSTLRASNVLKIKKNIDEAILTPEFFGPTQHADGDTIALPVSPVDGYTYSRDELTYVWTWTTLRPEVGSHVRIPVFYGSVNQSTGHVSLACWRFTDHYLDDNNTYCRITVVIVARRQQVPPAALVDGTGNPPSDVGTTTYPDGGVVFGTPGQGFFWSNGQMNSPFQNTTSGFNLQDIIVASNNEVFVVQFTLLATYIISTVSFICGANGTVHCGVGIYDANGNKVLDTGAISTAGVSNNIISKTLASPVTLPRGVYYFAQTCDNNLAVFNIGRLTQGTGTGTSIGALLNPTWASSFPNPQQGGGSIPLYCGKASNSSSAGALPSTLGTISAITGNNHNMLWVLFSV